MATTHATQIEKAAIEMTDKGKEEKTALHAEGVKKCGVLKETKDAQWNIAEQRRNILDDLLIVAKCTDQNTEEFNFGGICERVTDGIEKYKNVLLHPVFNRFYGMLYQKLQCDIEERKINARPELLKLFDALKDAEITAQFRLLDPTKSIDSICKEAQNFGNAKNNRENIAIVNSYILANLERLSEAPELKKLVEGIKAKYALKHQNDKDVSTREPTVQNLESAMQVKLTQIATISAIPGLCLFPMDYLIKKYDSSLTKEELTNRRSVALPLLREILGLVRDDQNKDSAQKVSRALLNLAHSMDASNKK